jgi:excisionase family DNA binding protein
VAVRRNSATIREGALGGRKRQDMATSTHSLSEAREVMSLRQASLYLGVSADTMYRYVSEGMVPAFKLGNRWKLRKSVLDRWMERKMSQPKPKRRKQ